MDPSLENSLRRVRNALTRIIGNGPRVTAAQGRMIALGMVLIATVMAIALCGLVAVASATGGRVAAPKGSAPGAAETARGSLRTAGNPAPPSALTPLGQWAFRDHGSACLGAPRDGDKAALTTRSAADGSTVRPGCWFVVDDGCAVGHMPKDVAQVAWLRSELAAGRYPECGKELAGLVLVHPCATRTAWTGMAQRTMFGSVLAPLFKAALPATAGVVFASDDAAAGPRCVERLFGRSKARWFGPMSSVGVAAEVGPVIARRYATGIVPPRRTESAQDGALAIAIVVRTKTRAWVDADGLKTAITEALGRLALSVNLVRLETAGGGPAQLARLASADIVVAAHGAALTLAPLALPANRFGGAAVVEVFPPGFRYAIFEEGLRSAGVAYFGVEAARAAPGASGACKSITCTAAGSGRPNIGENETVYEALRRINGHGACKNCPVDWRSGTNDAESTRSPVVAAVVEAARTVMLTRSGAQFADRRA